MSKLLELILNLGYRPKYPIRKQKLKKAGLALAPIALLTGVLYMRRYRQRQPA